MDDDGNVLLKFDNAAAGVLMHRRWQQVKRML